MIYINDNDPDAVWVTSDEDPIGCEVSFEPRIDPDQEVLIALAEFLGEGSSLKEKKWFNTEWKVR